MDCGLDCGLDWWAVGCGSVDCADLIAMFRVSNWGQVRTPISLYERLAASSQQPAASELRTSQLPSSCTKASNTNAT